MPPKRGNSMIKGSGHSYGGNKANRGSILRRSVKTSDGNTIEEDSAVFDMVLLDEINEEAIVKNITNMYMDDKIYVYIGNVIISVNPFKHIPDFYDDAAIERYRGRSAFDPKLPPHVFALADNVFSDMKWRGRDQVIIISGESGAGKTEASKKVMQYVAAVSGSSDAANTVKDKLLATNPVLEAFGNAKTTRNDNSSRFGKYMDIQFTYQGDPAGGHITTYLLEKARVVGQGAGERNFHIFYALLASAKAGALGLKADPMSYNLLKQGGDPKVPGMDDAQWFKEVEDGLKHVDFAPNDQVQIWNALASILLLGEVSFTAKGDGSAIANFPAGLEKVIGATRADIEIGLTHNTVVVNGELNAADLTADQASHSRDTLCKALYQRLFAWVAERINTSIAVPKKDTKAVIGVLDIYGFEIFTKNGFEQFCINYCNEKLQQLFIELTLKSEQDEYTAEGITWEPIVYFNNKVICDLVDAKSGGIIRTLEDEGSRPGDKSDATWLKALGATLGKHDHLQIASGPGDKSIAQDAFCIKHYAGDVTYSVDGFLDKNTDTLFKDIARLMFKSSNSVMKESFPEGDESTWAGASKRPLTAGRMFTNSMNEMVEILNAKVPSYVRCIKPNHKKATHSIDDELFRHQCKYLGLEENVRVRRAGFCFRETYADFFWRYRMLSKTTYPSWKGSDKEGTEEVLKSLAINPNGYQMGKTKLFIKSPKDVFRLEEERDEMMDVIANKLQNSWRNYLVRKNIGGWFKKMTAQFEPVQKLDGNNPTYGFAPSKVTFPKATASLQPMSAFLLRVYGSWWARKMIGPLAGPKQDLMRTQLKAHSLLGGGKKQGFALDGAKFSSHYAPDEPEGSRAAFEAANGPVLFSDAVQKISKGGKVDERVFVLTKSSIFLTKGWKASPARTIAINAATLSISTLPDTVVIVKGAAKGDWIINLTANTMAELVSRFTAKGNTGKFELTPSLSANQTGKPGKDATVTLRESADEACAERSVYVKSIKGFHYEAFEGV